MTHAQIAARYAVHIPPFDPEAAARDPFYWADHADEDLEATEARSRDEAWAQIKTGDVQ
jgi:hypothetical protein